MTIRQILEEAAQRIPRRDAEVLLTHVLARDRASLLAHPEAEVPPGKQRRLGELVARRAAREPLQYLTGRQEFYGLDLEVGPAVLIPRPETELLVEAVSGWAREAAGGSGRGLRLVDVGTGSGAIAIALASLLPEAAIWAVDRSPEALAVARGNAERLGFGERIAFGESDLLASTGSTDDGSTGWDVVVSNPPYVPTADAGSLEAEVRDFEPHMALFAGNDGLAIYRRLIPEAWRALRRGGLLALEFGFGQRAALADLLGDWQAVRFLNDYAAIPRIALATRP